MIVIVALLVGTSGVVTAKDKGGSTGGTYVIEISGIVASEISLVAMPEAVVRVIEFQDGSDLILRKRPGRTSVTNIIIASDLSNPALDDIWEWFENVRMGQYDRRSISITIVNDNGENIARYNALGTWPFNWRVVNQEGKDSNDSVIIEIEFVAEELYRMPSSMLTQ